MFCFGTLCHNASKAWKNAVLLHYRFAMVYLSTMFKNGKIFGKCGNLVQKTAGVL